MAEKTLPASEWDDLVDELFAVDEAHPYLSSMIETDADGVALSLGGEGSGYFGHPGRPGEVGGSLPSGHYGYTYTDFERQALDNLLRTSRTASGVSDTSSSADKPTLATAGEDLAEKTDANFKQALAYVWHQQQIPIDTAEDVQRVVEHVGQLVNAGLVKPGQSPLRTWDTKHNMPAAQVPAAMQDFYKGLATRLDGHHDPVATAAWVEQQFDSKIHPLADGVGRTSKVLSAWVLARGGAPLPTYPNRKDYYGHINTPAEEWTGYYRTFFPHGERKFGGEGSGDFGHAGRPGEVGGSAPSGTSPDDEKVPEWDPEWQQFTSDQGYEWHENGPVAEWAKELPYEDAEALRGYASFGYHDVNDLRRGDYTPPMISNFVREATPEDIAKAKASLEKITPEYLEQFPHPLNRSMRHLDPADPWLRVTDADGNYVGHYEHNVFYRNPAGDLVEHSIQRSGPNLARLHTVEKEADQLDTLIATHGYVLPKPMTVDRGAYLPGVTFEDLKTMADYPDDHGTWVEKGFTSTMVGPAEGRARSYPAIGKWESIYHRYENEPLAAHQDEVGTAVHFHIDLPAGMKVAPIEPVRRIQHNFPRVVVPVPDDMKDNDWFKEHPDTYTERDFTAKPTVKADDLHEKRTRSESELLIGSGARYRVTKVRHGETYNTGDHTLKPVPIVDVYMTYIGGGSSAK